MNRYNPFNCSNSFSLDTNQRNPSYTAIIPLAHLISAALDSGVFGCGIDHKDAVMKQGRIYPAPKFNSPWAMTKLSWII